MKTLLTGLLLAAAMLPALSWANICDRTPQVRDRILWNLQTDDCAAVDSEALAGGRMTILHLEDKQITALRAGDFAGMTRLKTLNLDGNQLTALPDGVFDGLSLEVLGLSSNRLTALPDGVFDDLTHPLYGEAALHTLRLSSNRLSALPDGVFDGVAGRRV